MDEMHTFLKCRCVILITVGCIFLSAPLCTKVQAQMLIDTLISDQARPGEGFGAAIDATSDGRIVVIGAPGYSDGTYTQEGSVYVFEYNNDAWMQIARLTPSTGTAGRSFGTEVVISEDGETIFVGAHLHNNQTGVVYFYECPAGGWIDMIETSILTAPNGAAGDQFGASISLFGDLLAVAAHMSDINGINSGSVYLFEKVDTTWTNIQLLTPAAPAADDRFGHSLHLGENTIVIGADRKAVNGINAGAVYIFEPDNGTWTEQGILYASNAANDDHFGNTIDASGNTVVVGARFGDGIVPNTGAVYLFEKPADGWPAASTETAKLVSSDGAPDDRCYYCRFAEGNDHTVYIGAPLKDNDTGAAYLYREPDGGWSSAASPLTETMRLTPPALSPDDVFGVSFCSFGNTLLMGAREDDDNGADAGAVYVYNDGAYYPFNGNANDEGGGGSDGAVIGAALTTDLMEKPDSAFDFNGVDTLIEAPDSETLRITNDCITMSVLVKLHEQGTNYIIQKGKIGCGVVMCCEYALLVCPDGTVCIDGENNTGTGTHWHLDSVQKLQVNRWYHLTGVRNGNRLELYINGKLDAAATTDIGTNTSNTGLLRIGGRATGLTGTFCNGTIDEVRIYTRPLTGNEVKTLFETTVPVQLYLPSTIDMSSTCTAEAPVLLSSLYDIAGFTIILSHDPAYLELTDIVEGAALSIAGITPQFWNVNLNPSGWSAGTAGGCLAASLSLSQPITTLPPGTGYEIARFVYKAKQAGTSNLSFADSIGNPPISLEANIVENNTPAGITPFIVQEGSITIDNVCFVRGDCDANGRITLNDAITVIYYLYADLAISCVDAADVNDDGGVDIADPVYLIDYLFRNGAPPPAPFSGCGTDPTEEDELDCTSFSPCS